MSWKCIKCHKEFITPDDYSDNTSGLPVVDKEYWLGLDPVCPECAIEIGIPPIDEEDDALL